MIIGAICLSAIMAWQAGASSPFDDPNYSNTSTGIAGIASIFIFSLVFSMSFGPGMSLPVPFSFLKQDANSSIMDLPIRDLPYESPSSRSISFNSK
jgi:hypothetical protein